MLFLVPIFLIQETRLAVSSRAMGVVTTIIVSPKLLHFKVLLPLLMARRAGTLTSTTFFCVPVEKKVDVFYLIFFFVFLALDDF
jgi:hypothetical protein